MSDLKRYIRDVPDFPQPGILFRDIAPLLRHDFDGATAALSDLLPPEAWTGIDALAGVESRGFILAAALATRHGKGFVPIRKKGKLPPPTVAATYKLEYGTDVLEMQPGTGTIVLVDDVLATGGTMQAAADLAARAGYSVEKLLVLIDLGLAPGFHWRSIAPLAALRY